MTATSSSSQLKRKAPHPSIDKALALLEGQANKKARDELAQPDARTANGAAAHASSGSARLDLFFGGLVRGAEAAKLRRQMASSWLEDPENTVQLLMHARDCRGGKGERACVLSCLLWLREHKPLTYLLNIDAMVAVGYMKDLVNLALQVHKLKMPKLGSAGEILELEILADYLRADMESLRVLQQWPKGKKKVVENEDPNEEEAEECKMVDEGEEQEKKEKPKITLAAKWAPTIGKEADKKARLAKRLAQLLFPDTATAFRDYRTKCISPLRAHLKVVERTMCAGEWDKIEFAAVPSVAHNRLKNAFERHQAERYAAFKEKVKTGEAKINAGALMPHDIVKQYLRSGELNDTNELQWTAILDKLKAMVGDGKGGMLGKAVSIVDVSGSMSGTPMEVAITLGIIVSELASGPFHKRLLTFHENPQWHHVSQDSLHGQVAAIRNMPWGMSTNLLKAFELILDSAVENKVDNEDMPKVLFIFSDMQFNSAVRDNFETTHTHVSKMYKKQGYELPTIVYWNLNGRFETVPVRKGEKGTALVSGFSPDLLKLFLEGSLDPMSVMFKAIRNYPVVVHPDEATPEQDPNRQ